MADGTHIEWTDATWNPITGCAVVSKGCTNCYAMKLAGTRLRHHPSRAGLTRDTKAGPVWTGEVRLNKQWLDQPLRWRRPRRIFVCAHGDLFAEGVPDEWIDRVFAVMALAGSLPSLSGLRPSPPLGHTFQVLTKRSARMRDYITEISRNPIPRLSDHIAAHMGKIAGATKLFANLRSDDLAEEISRFIDPDNGGWPLPNVWLGVSAEDQATADERIPELLATPAAVRFVSAEPLLGPIDFNDLPWPKDRPTFPDTDDISDGRTALRTIEGSKIDWVIVGGESGTDARPMHPDWARSIRDQCHGAGVAFFFKQWGAFEVTYDRDRDDPDWRRCGDIERKTPRGRWLNLEGGHGFHGDRVLRVVPAGKAAAGRLLDLREWSEFPEAGP